MSSFVGSRLSPVASSEPAASRSSVRPGPPRERPPLVALVVVALVVVGQRGGLVQHLRRRVDRALEPHRERDRVRRPRVHVVAAVRGDELQAGVERLIGERGDDDALDAHAERRQGRDEEVVGQGPLRGDPLQAHRDGLGLPGADPDGQDAPGADLLEQQHVPARAHVDADALDDHLEFGDAVVGHGGIIPRIDRPAVGARGWGVDGASVSGGPGGGGGGGPGSRRRDGRRLARRAGTPVPARHRPAGSATGSPSPRRPRTRRCAPRTRSPRPFPAASPSETSPSISCSRNQKPSTMIAGTAISS